MVEVIFFDAGGVLFDTPVKGDDRVRSLLMERGYPLSRIDIALRKAKQITLPFITRWETEEAYYKEYYGTIAKELGELVLAQELFKGTHYAAHCELYPEVVGVLEELSKHYKLAIISNAMPSMDWVFDRLGIRKYFDPIILSAFVETEKPGEEIFRIALDRANALAEECVFIDDKLENILGAERLGIRAIHLDRSKIDLVTLLKEHDLIRKEGFKEVTLE